MNQPTAAEIQAALRNFRDDAQAAADAMDQVILRWQNAAAEVQALLDRMKERDGR